MFSENVEKKVCSRFFRGNRSGYSGNADFSVQNGVFVPFSYRFRIVSFYAVSNAIWRKKKRRLNGVFPFSQSQGIN